MFFMLAKLTFSTPSPSDACFTDIIRQLKVCLTRTGTVQLLTWSRNNFLESPLMKTIVFLFRWSRNFSFILNDIVSRFPKACLAEKMPFVFTSWTDTLIIMWRKGCFFTSWTRNERSADGNSFSHEDSFDQMCFVQLKLEMETF